jgi:carbamoyl-phosphate synthase large subunit
MSHINETIKVIRSAVGSMASWGIIQELQKYNVEVIGVDSNPYSFGLYKLPKSYVIPRGDDPMYISTMLNLAKKEKVNAVISGPEEELIPLSRNRGLFEEQGTAILVSSSETVDTCVDKQKTYEFFLNNGIPMPEMYADINSVHFPCIIKPCLGRGSIGVYKLNNLEDLVFYSRGVSNPIFQEFIPGEEYSVDVLADRNGNALSIVPRLRVGVESGISVKSLTVFDADIIEQCKRIIKKLKIFGPACIQCIKNDRGIFFIEINLRFGGGSVLSMRADKSMIPNLLRLICDEKPIQSSGFTNGLMMMRHYSETYVHKDMITQKSHQSSEGI